MKNKKRKQCNGIASAKRPVDVAKEAQFRETMRQHRRLPGKQQLAIEDVIFGFGGGRKPGHENERSRFSGGADVARALRDLGPSQYEKIANLVAVFTQANAEIQTNAEAAWAMWDGLPAFERAICNMVNDLAAIVQDCRWATTLPCNLDGGRLTERSAAGIRRYEGAIAQIAAEFRQLLEAYRLTRQLGQPANETALRAKLKPVLARLKA